MQEKQLPLPGNFRGEPFRNEIGDWVYPEGSLDYLLKLNPNPIDLAPDKIISGLERGSVRNNSESNTA